MFFASSSCVTDSNTLRSSGQLGFFLKVAEPRESRFLQTILVLSLSKSTDVVKVKGEDPATPGLLP